MSIFKPVLENQLKLNEAYIERLRSFCCSEKALLILMQDENISENLVIKEAIENSIKEIDVLLKENPYKVV